MKTSYILIDYENVQPENLAVLREHPCKVLLFVGSNQAKIPVDLASAIQPLGDKAEYIRIQGNGKNALDFHIAFYAGQLAERDKDCHIHIITNDKGFDPLIEHLKSRKIHADRNKNVLELSFLKKAPASPGSEKFEDVVSKLSSRGPARPRKVKTLANTINSFYKKTLKTDEIKSIIDELSRRKYIVIDKENVSYRHPISQS